MSNKVFVYVFSIVFFSIAMLITCVIPLGYDSLKISKNLSKEQEIKVRRILKRILITLRVINVFIAIIMLYTVIIPFILDVPSFVSKDYHEVNGVVIENPTNNKSSRKLTLKEKETGKIYKIRIIGEDAAIGEETTIVYLKHLKVGSVKEE